MNSNAKGRRNLNRAMAHQEADGWITDEVELGGKFRKSKDLFSSLCTKCWKKDCEVHGESDRFKGFDFIAIKPKRIRLVQVKSNKPPTQLTYKRFAKKFASRYIEVVAMTWVDRKGWIIQKFNTNGSVTKTKEY